MWNAQAAEPPSPEDAGVQLKAYEAALEAAPPAAEEAPIPYGLAGAILIGAAFLAAGATAKVRSWRRAGLKLGPSITIEVLFLLVVSAVGALVGWRMWDPVLAAVVAFFGAVCSRGIVPVAISAIEQRTGLDLPDPPPDTDKVPVVCEHDDVEKPEADPSDVTTLPG